MTIRILLVDDHKIIRNSLRSMIENQSGLEIIGEADNGRTALMLVHDLLPDVVLMDIKMPGMDGILATMEIRRLHPSVKVIGLSMHSDKRFILRMMDAGASGYFLKDCALDEIIEGIRTVADGGTYLRSKVMDLSVR